MVWEVDEYDKTVKMSTYLVAYVISDFETISGFSGKSIQVEITARPDAIKNSEGNYSLDETKKTIDFFVDYFETEYPLPKISNIKTDKKN